jgi:hypothetical protein
MGEIPDGRAMPQLGILTADYGSMPSWDDPEKTVEIG